MKALVRPEYAHLQAVSQQIWKAQEKEIQEYKKARRQEEARRDSRKA